MAVALTHHIEADGALSPWHSFKAGLWQNQINVRDFIQQNYQPYEGDDSFLAPATERTRRLWNRLKDLFVEERKKGCSAYPKFQVRLLRKNSNSTMPSITFDLRHRRLLQLPARDFGRRV
jgi:pyruvate-formate lyase